jgi:hypothetical protein
VQGSGARFKPNDSIGWEKSMNWKILGRIDMASSVRVPSPMGLIMPESFGDQGFTISVLVRQKEGDGDFSDGRGDPVEGEVHTLSAVESLEVTSERAGETRRLV